MSEDRAAARSASAHGDARGAGARHARARAARGRRLPLRERTDARAGGGPRARARDAHERRGARGDRRPDRRGARGRAGGAAGHGRRACAASTRSPSRSAPRRRRAARDRRHRPARRRARRRAAWCSTTRATASAQQEDLEALVERDYGVQRLRVRARRAARRRAAGRGRALVPGASAGVGRRPLHRGRSGRARRAPGGAHPARARTRVRGQRTPSSRPVRDVSRDGRGCARGATPRRCARRPWAERADRGSRRPSLCAALSRPRRTLARLVFARSALLRFAVSASCARLPAHRWACPHRVCPPGAGCTTPTEHFHDFAHQAAAKGRRTLRPPLRARCVRRGHGRAPGQPAHPRGPLAGDRRRSRTSSIAAPPARTRAPATAPAS